MIRGGEKRCQRRHHGNRGKTEIALAVLRRLKSFHHARRRAYCAPADPVFPRDDEAAVQGLRVDQNLRQQVGPPSQIVRIQHGRPNRRSKLFLGCQRVVLL